MYLPKKNIPAINWQFLLMQADISENQMQRIAKEMNYSETTFVVKDIRAGGYEVRIFTRTRTTIRRSSYLRNLRAATRNHQQPAQTIILNLKNWANTWRLQYADGAVDWLWMQQIPPTFAQVFVAETIAQVLNLEPGEIDSQFRFKKFLLVPFIIVPLKNQSALKRSKVNKDKYFEQSILLKQNPYLFSVPQTNQ